MTQVWIRDSRSPEQVSEEFWAEQKARRSRREEIAAMPRKFERFGALLADVWTTDNLMAVMTDGPLLFRSQPDALDQWLAEDGRVPEVYEALGIRQRWEAAPSLLNRLIKQEKP